MKLIHIYPQSRSEDDLYIVGTNHGLTALYAAIEKALEDDIAEDQVVASDGKTYLVKIIREQQEELDSDHWKQMLLPYCSKNPGDAEYEVRYEPRQIWREIDLCKRGKKLM